jgi:hypothetical protein
MLHGTFSLRGDRTEYPLRGVDSAVKILIPFIRARVIYCTTHLSLLEITSDHLRGI